MDARTRDAAKRLSALGAAKGGAARAKALSRERRSEIAREAALKRWGGRPRPTRTVGERAAAEGLAVPTAAEARESFERIMAGCGRAGVVRALHAAYTSDPAVRQALGNVRGFAGFWMKVLAALDGPGGE